MTATTDLDGAGLRRAMLIFRVVRRSKIQRSKGWGTPMKLRLLLVPLLTLTFFGLTSEFAQFTPSQDSYTTSVVANRGTNFGVPWF
jgi:hypothetical protein